MVARLYLEGLGVPQDCAVAAKWLQPVAERGDRWAQYQLAVLYQNGRGVAKDPTQAIAWATRAAEQGYPEAQNLVGSLMSQRQPVSNPPDNISAYMWLSLAAARGDKQAAANLASLDQQMSSGEIAEAKRRAAERWKQQRSVK